MDITIKELSKLKQQAETEIAKEVSRILADFKNKSGIRFAEHSICINMIHSITLDHMHCESFVSDAEIRMEIFDVD
jgi:hypothetical protein